MPLPIQGASMGMNAAAVEPMDLGDDGGDLGQRDQILPEDHQVYNPTLDLEQYGNNYKGLARIYRLMYVADHCPPLRTDALLMTLHYVQTSTFNWQMYQEIHKKLATLPNEADLLPNSIPDGHQRQLPAFDTQWVEQIMKKGSMKLDKLDTDLKHYKSNSIKESIRRGQDDLGEHYLEMGELMNALKCFSRARDYCTSNKHIVSMCYNVIKVSAYSQNWSLVLSYVNRAEGTPELSQPQTGKDAATGRLHALSKLKSAAGLAELANKKYKASAKQFLQVSFDHLDYPELVSANNVAIYGSLCALASFDRHELQTSVIGNTSFKQFLELEPQMNEIITKFYESKYASCLKLLDEIKDNLLIDLYLAPHVSALYSMIRNRGLIQYFSPYLSADMRRMAISFNTTVSSLEDELSQLILDGQIKARIDSHNKIMYAKDVDQRASTYEKALSAGTTIQQRTKALVLRAAIQRANICVKASPREPTTNVITGSNEITVTPSNSGPSSPR